MKRREFNKSILAMGTAAFPVIQAIPSKAGGERIRVAIIGCGVRGSQHISEIAPCKELNVEISHVCDVWQPAREQAAKRVEELMDNKPKQVIDYTDILKDPAVDAVTIATPDIGHAQILKEAAEAGKDVYCEKPMAIDLEEANQAVDAVRANKRVVQCGTQWHSDPNYAGCAKVAHSGVLGKITRIAISQNFHEPRWRKEFSTVKEQDVNWDLFQMKRVEGPFSAQKFKRWYLYRDYTNGLPGLWMSHYLNLVAWLMKDPIPATAVASGKVYLWGDDGRQTSDTLSAIYDYPSGFQLNFSMSLCNSADTHCTVYGTNGKLDVINRKLSGDGGAGDDRIKEETNVEPVKLTSHFWNFFECMRSRQDPRSSIDMGYAHAAAGIMCAESIRSGKRVTYDFSKRALIFG